MEFETEEQQVEALKKWWKENGKQVIVGAIIGFSVIIGWRYYIDYTGKQAAEASALFEQMIQANETASAVDKVAVYEKIKNNFSSTPYNSAAALVVAKSYYLSGDKEKAIAVFDDLIANNKYEVVSLLARERKARILLDMGKADAALSVLDVKEMKGFEAIYSELEGDAYVLQGNKTKARMAYDKALLLNESGAKQLLQMKRNNLGDGEVESAA